MLEKVMQTMIPKIIEPKEKIFKEWLLEEKQKRHFYIGVLDPDKNTYTIELWQKVNPSHNQKVKDVFEGKADQFIKDILNQITKGKDE